MQLWVKYTSSHFFWICSVYRTLERKFAGRIQQLFTVYVNSMHFTYAAISKLKKQQHTQQQKNHEELRILGSSCKNICSALARPQIAWFLLLTRQATLSRSEETSSYWHSTKTHYPGVLVSESKCWANLCIGLLYFQLAAHTVFSSPPLRLAWKSRLYLIAWLMQYRLVLVDDFQMGLNISTLNVDNDLFTRSLKWHGPK